MTSVLSAAPACFHCNDVLSVALPQPARSRNRDVASGLPSRLKKKKDLSLTIRLVNGRQHRQQPVSGRPWPLCVNGRAAVSWTKQRVIWLLHTHK